MVPELAVPDPCPPAETFRRYMVGTARIAERDGVPVGIAYYQVLDRAGYVRNLITDPDHRRTGAGRALMEDVRTLLRAAGCAEWRLNVREANIPAVRLYESLGFTPAYQSKVLVVPLRIADDEHPPTMVVRPIEPDDDPIVERELDLLPGLVASARGRPGRVLLLLEDGGEPVRSLAGAAVFDPAFPGAYPFRARSADAALALLAAIRPHARPTDDSISLVIEDAEAIAAALLARGATLRDEMIHMRGQL
jgi:hypothetical protein